MTSGVGGKSGGSDVDRLQVGYDGDRM